MNKIIIVMCFVWNLVLVQHIEEKHFNKIPWINKVLNNVTRTKNISLKILPSSHTGLNMLSLPETGLKKLENVYWKKSRIAHEINQRKRWVVSNETRSNVQTNKRSLNIPQIRRSLLEEPSRKPIPIVTVIPTLISLNEPRKPDLIIPQSNREKHLIGIPSRKPILIVSTPRLNPMKPTRKSSLNIPQPTLEPSLNTVKPTRQANLNTPPIRVPFLSSTHEAFSREMRRNETPAKTLPEPNMTTQDTFMVIEDVVLDKTRPRKVETLKCGVDKSNESRVYEGRAYIETYPWLGWFIYPLPGDKAMTTVVVLVQRQLVIASAVHIHKLPKTNFRAKSKVVMGRNCSGASLRVLTYNYHPEYRAGTYSALVLIQLDTSALEQDIRPICPPPKSFTQATFHAMVLPDDCSSSKITIYEMQHVPLDQCRHFYRRSGLDIETIWPTHAACGRARAGGECVWRSGAALVVRQHGRWHLVGVRTWCGLGFGVSGPGCSAPARFLDYGQYRRWVAASALRVGRPALTRLAHNHLVLRRSLTHIQRFGPCDPEEMETELFTDRTEIRPPVQYKHRLGRVRYNLTILANVEYSCISLRADYDPRMASTGTPHITLRRFCRAPAPLCYEAGILRIDFSIEILYYREITYKLAVYGQEWKVVDAKSLLKYINEKKPSPKVPYIPPRV